MKDYKTNLSYLLFVTVATIWIGLTVILPDFIDNPIHGIRGVLAGQPHQK